MTVNKSICPNCGELVPNDEHFNEKCFNCVDPSEVVIDND